MNLWFTSGRFVFRLLPVIIVYWIGGITAQADERLWLTGISINGKVARFAFDTGTSYLVLFQTGAARLGLSFTNAPKNPSLQAGQVPMGETEVCDLQFAGNTFRTNIPVVEVPAEVTWDLDGVVGWSALKNNILSINACQGTVSLLSNIPREATNWVRLNIDTNSDDLHLLVPTLGSESSNIAVDTGSDHGVLLPAKTWRDWKASHANQPLTLRADVLASIGLVVLEEGWAEKLEIGPLAIEDVPVSEASKADTALGGSGYAGTMGLAALKRLDLITDGSRGAAYLRVRRAPSSAYSYNRLGAVFVPSDLQSGDNLVAHVVSGGPAWKAGIRSGDTLTRIGQLDVTKWRTDPAVLPLGRFWARPAGTKLELTVQRGTNVFEATAVLREILSPEASSAADVPREKPK